MDHINKNTIQEFKECACKDCCNQGTNCLEVKFLKRKGWFCDSCALVLKHEGIAQEVVQ